MFNLFLRSSTNPLCVPQTFPRCASQLRLVQSFNRYYSDLPRSSSPHPAKPIAADADEAVDGQNGRSRKTPQGRHDIDVSGPNTEGTGGHVSERAITPSAEQLLQWMEPVDLPRTLSEEKKGPKRTRKKQDALKSETVANEKKERKGLRSGEGNNKADGKAPKRKRKNQDDLNSGVVATAKSEDKSPGSGNANDKAAGLENGPVRIPLVEGLLAGDPEVKKKQEAIDRMGKPRRKKLMDGVGMVKKKAIRGPRSKQKKIADETTEESGSSGQIPPGSPRKTVTIELKNAYERSKDGKGTGDTRRVHVVSNELCDDILERMKPSLMKHVGCDILDINPGPAIWSSKVHQLLQPRKHILMEPEEIYSPFIEPLLEATDSTFALHRGSGIVFSQLDSVLSKEQLPNQEELSRDDPRSFEPNETLLVLANISFYPKRPFKGFSSVAHLLLHQMVGSIVHRNFFHKYGQVRMLIWMVDGDRFLALPRHVHTRKKSSVEYAVSCSHITEVASSTLPQKHFPRHFDAEIESARRIKARMEANGIETPAGRESVFFQQLSGITTGAQGLTKTRAEVHRFSTELPALEAQYAAKEFGKYTVEGGDPTQIIPRREITRRGPKRVSDFYSPLYNRMKTLRHLKDSFDRRIAENATWISEQRDLLSQQAVIHNSTGSDAQAERERLLALRKELGERVDSMLDHQNSRMMATQLETDRCSRTDPPGFLYDRREEEPLRVKADEFFPKHELALLDFEPREFWPVLKEDIGNYDVVEYILTSINHFPSWTVAASLKALWPGAYEWLSKECPSLTDPAKGGDDDLSMINVRCLNTEHIKEIIEAWLRWPFKPTRGQLIGRLSHMVHDDDVGDTNYTEGIPDEETEENDEEATEESI